MSATKLESGYGVANALIRSADTEVWHFREQFAAVMAGTASGFARHDHAGLTVAALRNLILDPGLLDGVALRSGWGESFDCSDALAHGGTHIEHAGMLALIIDDDSASPAYFDAASVLSSGQSQQVSQDP